MNLDLISEKKAKEILDFLAQKIGFDGFEVSQKTSLCYAYCYVYSVDSKSNMKSDKKELRHLFCGDCVLSLTMPKTSSDVYLAMLETMLKISATGQTVNCLSAFAKDYTFLPAFTNLESLLVQMDLEM